MSSAWPQRRREDVSEIRFDTGAVEVTFGALGGVRTVLTVRRRPHVEVVWSSLLVEQPMCRMDHVQGTSASAKLQAGRMFRSSLLVIVAAGFSACTPHQEQTDSPTLSELVERPDDYSGQEVEVSGFMLVSWEGGGIFKTGSDGLLLGAGASVEAEHAPSSMTSTPGNTLEGSVAIV